MQNKGFAVKYLLSLKIYPNDISITEFVLGKFLLSDEIVLEIFLKISLQFNG